MRPEQAYAAFRLREGACRRLSVGGSSKRQPAMRQRRGFASLTPTFDVSRAAPQTAVIVIGSKAGDSGSLFTGDAADLRHAHQDGDRGSQPDTIHAGD